MSFLYVFGGENSTSEPPSYQLLGGKGGGLVRMSQLDLPVPPGFVITTPVCEYFHANNKTYPDKLRTDVDEAIKNISIKVGARFGDPDNPLLLAVRSGAYVSMPGMMDTILNIGINSASVHGLAKQSGDMIFALDSWRRLIQMYGNVVMGVPFSHFDAIIERARNDSATYDETSFRVEEWQIVIREYLDLIKNTTGRPFPEDVNEQLWGAIGAVFGSWLNTRAVTYRRLHDIPSTGGTAVTVQSMVFGNRGNDSCTGVIFSRDPSTGEKVLFGEYLPNSQGEDVVAGFRTPLFIDLLKQNMPAVYDQLVNVANRLELAERDMQEIEFTVQQSKLYVLQTRAGKRSTKAALRIVLNLVAEGVITEIEAVKRIDASSLSSLLHPTLDPSFQRNIITRGLPASPGVASGIIAFSADVAEKLSASGAKVILCRSETNPEDIHGMHAAAGILTSRGGMTSHAAVVARGIGRPCIVGAGDVKIDIARGIMKINEVILKAGEQITIDGGSGEVMQGAMPVIEPVLPEDFINLMKLADKVRRLRVRANADTPEEARRARAFGAEGIGLCRTEHMFFDPLRIKAMRAMILASSEEERIASLAAIEPMQRNDFIEMLAIMDGLPVTIRLLDPPLHEFLPNTEEEISSVAKELNVSTERVRSSIRDLRETNPMLGNRGCRLGITRPEIYEMQTRAIISAAVEVVQRGQNVSLEIMVPLVATLQEFEFIRTMITRITREVSVRNGVNINPYVGTMIELPRAALQAGNIAKAATFFSFGTNDLTQTTFGISRDDSSMFISEYIRNGIVSKDPFASIDIDGVGELINIAVERGRAVRPDLKIGICGEHGGDPASIDFFHRAGLDYVSCSPWRLHIARLAAAQAALRDKY